MDLQEKPNILLILVDQVRRDSVGCYGSRICRTPFIDQIAANGLRFDSAYTSISLCSPARASIFTGLYPHQHGMLFNTTSSLFGRSILAPDTKLINYYLGRAGYKCGYAGKWHISEKGPAEYDFKGTTFPGFGLPNEFVEDYDQFLKSQGHAGMRSINVRDYSTPMGSLDLRLPLQFGYDGIIQVPAELTPSGFVASKTIELLEEMEEGPFFITSSFWGPHHPGLPSEEYAKLYSSEDIPPWPNFEDDLSDKPHIQSRYRRCLNKFFSNTTWSTWAKTISRHYAFLTMIDSQIGRILDSLERLKLDRKTIVIFTSDHGDTLGCHGGQFDKGPYMYEETYLVPLLMQFPDNYVKKEIKGKLVSSLISNMDIFPTILDFAGIGIPEGLHAISFAATKDNLDYSARDTLIAHFNGFDARGMYLQRMIRYGHYKYIFNPGDFDELYNLNEDPYELCNLISDTGISKIRHDLQVRLAAEMKTSGDPHAHHIKDFLEL